ncbi:MAG: RidA family protein [Candidatus Eremiobacteraeota bacterium]|nr:RidA family protein [Candidatus Eremiobacteraeota bacterium]
MSEAVLTGDAPAPIGPYSQAVRSGELVFCSGQVALDPKTGELVAPGDVAAQTERALQNISAVLTAAGLSPENVVKTTVFLVDMSDFATVNEVYARYLGEAKPARSTVAVAGLPKGARVEIEAIARA